MPDLTFLSQKRQKVVSSLTHAKALNKGLLGFSADRRQLIKKFLLKGIHNFISRAQFQHPHGKEAKKNARGNSIINS